MSHRIIEKRRRDRMNNCLADLSRLIPAEYLKKGRGRIEKTEIIEMAIKHMKHLQSQERASPVEHYRLGYQECMSEAMRFMVEIEGHFPREPVCLRLLTHLQNHCDQVARGGSGFAASPPASAFPPSQASRAPPSPRPPPCDFTVPKTEPENSNSSDAFIARPDRETAPNGASYKYKTSIKLRFSQDASAHEVPKRQRLDDNRNGPLAAVFDNQSSNQSPPRISDQNGQALETDHPSTPPTSSDCASPTGTATHIRPSGPAPPMSADNFDVPVFVLHTKSSYYVPLTIDYKTLLPFLHTHDLLDAVPATVLHPVTINVNFLPLLKPPRYKYECNNNWH